jgi:hypothetical protein
MLAVGLAHQVIHGVRIVDGIYSAEKVGKLRDTSFGLGPPATNDGNDAERSSPPMGSPDHPYPLHAQTQLQQFGIQHRDILNLDTVGLTETSGNNGTADMRKRSSGSMSPTRRYQESTFASRANEHDYDPVVPATLTSYNMKLHSRNPKNSPRSVLANKGLPLDPYTGTDSVDHGMLLRGEYENNDDYVDDNMHLSGGVSSRYGHQNVDESRHHSMGGMVDTPVLPSFGRHSGGEYENFNR